MSLFEELPPEVSLKAQIKEARREVAMRKRVYPRWVERGRMGEAEASEKIYLMEAIVKTLEDLHIKENIA